MVMAEIFRQSLIAASTANLTGEELICLGLEQLFVEVQVEATVADLQAVLTLEQAVSDGAFLAASNGTLIASSDGSLTYNAAMGELTINNPGTGLVHVALLRFDRPAKRFRPVYAYGSGGGAPVVQTVVYGWQTNTTP